MDSSERLASSKQFQMNGYTVRSWFPRQPCLSLATLSAVAILLPRSARAANTVLFYDSDGATTTNTGAVAGAGTWDATTATQWRPGSSTGTPLQAYTNTGSATTADFAGTAGTVTIANGLTVNANNLTFGTSGYTIASGNSSSILNFDGTTPAINFTANGFSEIISAKINASAGFTLGTTSGTAIADSLTLSGSNTIAGIITISSNNSSNTLTVTNAAALGTAAVTTTGLTGSLVLNLTGTNSISNSITVGTAGVSNNGALQNTGGINTLSSFSFAGTGGVRVAVSSGSTLILANTVTGSSNTVRLLGSGTLELDADNSTAASGKIGSLVLGNSGTAYAPTIKVGNNASLGSGTVTFDGNSSATIQSVDATAHTVANNIVLNSNVTGITFGTASTGNLTFNGTVALSSNLVATVNNPNTTLAGNITGTNFGINLAGGSGTLTLSGVANAYTGATQVSSGTLLMNGTHTGAGAYTINNGGTLGGGGSITTATGSPTGVTIASGGKLSPGSAPSTVGTLTMVLGSGVLDISGATSGANTGALVFDLGASLSSDKVLLTSGTLAVATDTLDMSDFTFVAGSGITTGQYTLFDTNNTITNFANITTGIASETSFDGGYKGYLSLGPGNQDLLLNVTVVPEPASLGLLSLAAMGMLARRHRVIA